MVSWGIQWSMCIVYFYLYISSMKILQLQGQEKEPVFINAKVMNEKFMRSTNQSFIGHAFQTYCRETSLHGWKYVLQTSR